MEALFVGKKNVYAKYEFLFIEGSGTSGSFIRYKCSGTVYNAKKPKNVGKSSGRCRLEQNSLVLKNRFDGGRIEDGSSWQPYSTIYEQYWPNNLATIKRNETIRTALVIIFVVVFFHGVDGMRDW